MTPVSPSCDAGALSERVALLATLDLKGLRQVWRVEIGEPPKLRSVELLRQLLAWRLQAAVHGGLDRETRQALKASGRSGAKGRLQVGTRLAREHRGMEHQVEVTETGFRYQGRAYASLSVIAREITGTRWNGWRFFGVTEVKS